MAMTEDPQMSIRKAATESLVKISDIMSKSFFLNKLFPLYKKYIYVNNRMSEESYWGIREIAAIGLGKICLNSPKDLDSSIFFALFKGFYEDPNGYVKKAALMQSGKVIYSLKGKTIPSFLLDLYISQADIKYTGDEEAVFQCAFIFPAVLSASGAKNWPSLQEAYLKLTKSNIRKVKKTMVASIHEIAAMVGPKVCT